MDPDSPVRERLTNIFEVPLVCKTVAILSKATIDFSAFFVIKEFCGVRIVVDLKVSPDGDDECDDSL